MKTALEALFEAMEGGGWFCGTDGNVEAPTGAFGWVTNAENEIPQILDAFADVVSVYGVPNAEDMIGHFLMVTDSQGFHDITRYDSEVEAYAAYRHLSADFLLWNAQDASADNVQIRVSSEDYRQKDFDTVADAAQFDEDSDD